MNRKVIVLILFVFLLIISTSGYSQSGESSSNETKVSEITLKFVDGIITSRKLGTDDYKQAIIYQKILDNEEITLTDNTECILGLNGNEIHLYGPATIRIKDIINSSIRLTRINLNNKNINRIFKLFTNANNELILTKITDQSTDQEIEIYKKIVRTQKKGYSERAFTIGYEYIQKVRMTNYKLRKKPDLFVFYYMLTEIAAQTLNYNIAEASLYKIFSETSPNDKNGFDRARIETRINAYFISSIIHSIKSEYKISVEYLNKIIEESSTDAYFNERIGYLVYFMLWVNYKELRNNEAASNSLKQASDLCNITIDNNIKTFRNLLKMKRNKPIQENIDKYKIYLEEASYMLNYIQEANIH